jgi:predicted ATPase/class 3 adenylate cyclase
VGALPSGTVTFLFTDIEGSTRLLHELGDAYPKVLADHRNALRAAFADHSGVEVDTQGDAFFVAFASAIDAANAALSAQRALAGSKVKVRMGIHTGDPTLTTEGYVGIDVHRGARICAAGHGGQILASKRTRELLDPGTELADLGEHRLKDLREPEWLFQLNTSELEQRFPPLRSLSNTNLPADASQFVGRRRELDELGALLGRDAVRLLTLTGPGGTGKTRLAIRLAAEFVEQFKNGVFFVPLASVSEQPRVLATIAETLGAQQAMDESAFEGLRRHLESKQMLLVLDNFEQVLAAGPDIARLLAAARQLRVIVTSRERLRLSGEHEYAVPPMPQDDAVALFDIRAIAAKPSFRVDIDRKPVSAICRRLDGLPLAVELAAARVKMITPQALLERLEQLLPTLTGGPRDQPERQQTLRATIEWSYLLLHENEQRVFARLSVFVGGCTAAAAKTVCGATFEDLASLVDKSLLRQDDGFEGVPRFSMLETIREYANEQLERSGSRNELARAHAYYFESLAFIESEGRGHGGPRLDNYRRSYVDSLEWLSREQENMRVALLCLIEKGDAAKAVRLVPSICRLWVHRNMLVEGQAWTEKVAAMRGASESPEFGWFLGCSAEFPRFRGDLSRARSLEERSIAILRTGDQHQLAARIESLANIVDGQGDRETARTLHEESLRMARELEDDLLAAMALNGLARMAFRQGDYVLMEELAEQEVALGRKSTGDGIPEYLGDLAEARRRLGKLDGAAAAWREALDVTVRVRDVYLVAEALDGAADLAAARSDFERATTLWAASARLFAESDQPPWDAEGTEAGKAEALSALGRERFDDAWRAGARLSQDEAVECAMRAIASEGVPSA